MALEFGTAGVRGIVGDDDNQLNNQLVASIFDGYAKYLKNKYQNQEVKIVIGRDNRRRGKLFANIAAKILTRYGIKVYFNDEMLPTPFVSFLIKYKKAQGGINITASHNPKEYNGIKLYNEFGYQMLPNEINEVKKFFDSVDKFNEYQNFNDINIKSNNILNIQENDYETYVNEVVKLCKDIDFSNIKIVYSPLHGTGYKFVKQIFEKLNANVIYEENEIIEDPEFSYVKNPNPENTVAFENTIKIAQKENADLILLTDPDSDRVGVAYKNGDEYSLINGNENALLITEYLLKNKEIKKDSYLVYSFVSTSLPAKMCQENQIKSYITETGFKWIGQKIEDNKDKENFFFAFEESYGSLVNENLSLDKDAIQSLMMIASICASAKREGMNLNDKLEQIYSQYGYMKAKSFSFDLRSKEQLEEIKSKFRTLDFNDADFFDYSKGIRNIEPNDMLSYEFKNSINWISLRPSGTEPKFKVYIHVAEKTKEESEKVFNDLYNRITSKLEL